MVSEGPPHLVIRRGGTTSVQRVKPEVPPTGKSNAFDPFPKLVLARHANQSICFNVLPRKKLMRPISAPRKVTTFNTL
jgi:hypothetical protein